ncbi:MAG: Sensor protein EvgS [Xylophilus sp.]|nr:MAG: Sensor protein EvgS [Xylophilus sp.]
MQRLVDHGEQFQIEKRCLRKDGSIVWLHNSASLLADAAGQPAAAIVVCTDISERQHAEAALRESTDWLRLIIKNAVEYAIFSTDLDRRVTSWNSGAERLLGYSESEALGQLADMIFTPEDRAANAPEQEARAALDGDGANDERLHQRKDGSRFWASGATMAMQDGRGATVGFVKILRDQSAQRASQQALEQSRTELLSALQENENARAALLSADEAKDRFLAVLSHELRNPLASISSASMAVSTGRLSPEDQDRAARIVQRQAQIMKVLLDDLLDVSRLRLGKLALQTRILPLSTVVESALETAQALVDNGGHVLEVRLPERPVLLDADPVRLAQVLSNLLSNAARYTPAGGRIVLHAELRPPRVVIVVEDNGIGMEPATVESMFEMFSQSSHATDRGSHGLGIGLALARNIVHLHHGEIHGESDGPGRGSRFTVELPLAAMDEAMQGAAPRPEAGMPQVLIVDDNADVTWSVARLLTGCGVATADTGSQALQLLEQQRFDAVVLDLGLPDMSGFEVARAIRAHPLGAELLLIAATGWGQENDRRMAREAGFDAHLVKPLDVDELKKLIFRRRPQ